MPSIYDKDFQASFDKVPFSVRSASTTGGRKFVKHKFVNSDNQVVEDLGKDERVFKVEGFIGFRGEDSETASEDFLLRKKRLEDVLESGKVSTLVHPFDGIIEGVKPVNYTKSESFKETGIAYYSITFEVDSEQAIPKVTGLTSKEFSAKRIASISKSSSSFFGDFEIPDFSNITDSIAQVESIIVKVEDAAKIFTMLSDKVDSFNAAISNISTRVATLINTPQELVLAFDTLFETLDGAHASFNNSFNLQDNPSKTSTNVIEDEQEASPAASFEVFSEILILEDPVLEELNDRTNGVDIPVAGGYGEAEPYTTQILKIRISNREVLNRFINELSLAYSFSTATEIEFETVEQQDELAERLNFSFEEVSDGKNHDLIDERISVVDFFEDAEINLGRQVSIFTNETSARLLAFQYYGSAELGEVLATSNLRTDASFFESGDAKVISR